MSNLKHNCDKYSFFKFSNDSRLVLEKSFLAISSTLQKEVERKKYIIPVLSQERKTHSPTHIVSRQAENHNPKQTSDFTFMLCIH